MSDKVIGTEDHPTGGTQPVTESEMTADAPEQSGQVNPYGKHIHLADLYEQVADDNPVVAVRHGMWGDGKAASSGDTSGFGGLTRVVKLNGDANPPFGGWFDDVADRMAELVPHFATRTMVWRDQITFFVRRDKLVELAQHLRDDPQLRFEVCVGLAGVHYPQIAGHELHVVYQLLSFTYNRRITLEVELPDSDPHVPSLTCVYPMVNYHERETWDMFGIIFDGHPALTRILMPDDWVGHPQRKDYPLGGIPVEYKGAVVPPPDQRRSYQA